MKRSYGVYDGEAQDVIEIAVPAQIHANTRCECAHRLTFPVSLMLLVRVRPHAITFATVVELCREKIDCLAAFWFGFEHCEIIELSLVH